MGLAAGYRLPYGIDWLGLSCEHETITKDHKEFFRVTPVHLRLRRTRSSHDGLKMRPLVVQVR